MKRYLVFSLVICALILGMTSVSLAGTQSLTMESEPATVSESNLDMSNSDELLTEFVTKHASAKAMGVQAVSKKTRRARLTGNDAIVYDELKKSAEKIAAGEEASSVIDVSISDMLGGKLEFTADDLGVDSLLNGGKISKDAVAALEALYDFDAEKVMKALLYDTPYEFYWFDKVSGYFINTNIYSYMVEDKDGEPVLGMITKNEGDDPVWVVQCYVSKDYSKTGIVGTTDLDTKRTKAASAAATTAGSIVKKNASKTDFNKLTAYKDKVCELTDYNDDAADPDKEIGYGDPWQLIYVFDGDESTKVVCEGYSKAFQFLCDLSEFSNGIIKSYIVTGDMEGGTGAGSHMWNMVHMDDGKNYIADITNCDEGTIGAPDLLFLKGYTEGHFLKGYKFKWDEEYVYYFYSMDTRNQYDNDELTLSKTDYEEVICDHDLQKTDAKEATCTSDGNTAYWQCSKCKGFFSDADAKNAIDEGDWVIPGGHDYGKLIEKVNATCTEDGMKEHYECSRCHELFDAKKVETTKAALTIKAEGHDIGSLIPEKEPSCDKEGMKAHYECSVCQKLFVKEGGEYVEKKASDLVIPKLEHHIEYVEMEKATAAAAGNIGYWRCTECGTCFSDAEGKTAIDMEDTIIPVNNFKVTAKKKLYAAKAKKKTTIKGTAVYNLKNKKGKVTYKKSSGKAKFTVSSKTGNIVVKKGLKKGTYTVKVRVTTAATAQYTACSRIVSVKIKVK